MKLEKPPSSNIELDEIFDVYVSRKYQSYLNSIEIRYPYWDEIKYQKNLPFDGDAIKTWKLLKKSRILNYKWLTFGQYTFAYNLTPSIHKDLHEFDLKMIGGLYQNPITETEKKEYLNRSLMEEAIASSQIEGAATTTKVALDMLRSGRKPRTESEQMIFNNLRAIKFIEENSTRNIDKEFIIELHQIMTIATSAAECAGDYRKEAIYVTDHVNGEVAHIPPDWEQIESLMSSLCDFANTEKEFIHPIAKASILHFLIGFFHPFKDGNGRTARAIFYWYLSKKGYSLIKNISISRAILESRIQYDKAFLKTEYDNNDMTYFIVYSIKSLRVAFDSLVRYRDKKKSERESAGILAYKLIEKGLSKRQADLISYLFVNANSFIALQTYSTKHNIVRQTARKDVNQLIQLGLITEEKQGKEITFTLTSEKALDAFINS